MTYVSQYEPFLTGDNRRSNNRPCCTFAELKNIVEEAQNIPSNLGNPFVKISRIHNEAELWMETHKDLLERCGIGSNAPSNILCKKAATINEVNAVVDRATKDLAVDLDEVKKLEEIVAHSQDWFAKASEYTLDRSKLDSGSKGCRIQKCTVDDVVALIKKSDMIPLDTSEDVARLNLLLNDVQSFRQESLKKFKDVACALNGIVEDREHRHGKATEFLSVQNKPSHVESEIVNHEVGQMGKLLKDDFSEVSRVVEYMLQEADSLSVFTFEEVVAKQLATVLKWCQKAGGVIDNHQRVFVETQEKHHLDELLSEVSDVKLSSDFVKVSSPKHGTEEAESLNLLKSSVAKLLSDDLCRLNILRSKRHEYHIWCQKINDCYINSDKRVSIETLTTFAKEGTKYPQSKFILFSFRFYDDSSVICLT